MTDLGAMSDSEDGFFTGCVPVPPCVLDLDVSACARPGVDHVAAAAIKAALKHRRSARPPNRCIVERIAVSFEGDSVQP
jgi:hypothetical protein